MPKLRTGKVISREKAIWILSKQYGVRLPNEIEIQQVIENFRISTGAGMDIPFRRKSEKKKEKHEWMNNFFTQ